MHYWFILTLGLALTAVACGDDGPPAEGQKPQEEVQRPAAPA